MHKLTDWVQYRDHLKAIDVSKLPISDFEEGIKVAFRDSKVECSEPRGYAPPNMTIKYAQALRRRAQKVYARSRNAYDRQAAAKALALLRKHRRLLRQKHWADVCRDLGQQPTSRAYKIAKGLSTRNEPLQSFACAAFYAGTEIDFAFDEFTIYVSSTFRCIISRAT